ncbi:sigma-B regulation protein RsbU (phosphoserine phosphatase) [Halospina denitrificans]|uniref:Sigma-B regulation protein RsbU (Phosphoserine phosphatase) n=1 Tax=Halospina denitrificans TaxID=332522 RepID=A0A4R7JVA7_9GAMM|nr:SpoIIE family protein phosphatase [Halospina denitrificans]TDT41397.1 sigma-B regulation protein RsbU (phosphoserine phosphatase) [Halospina denitrificans]
MATRTEQILIIDPDEASRGDLSRHLRARGYYVTACDSLAKGVAELSTAFPDVIFADLPPESIHRLAHGEQALGDLTTPIIAFSGAETAAEVVSALRAGASDFVIKPIRDKGTVDSVLGKLFERVRVARLNEVYREELETKNLNLSEGISELRADQTAGRKVQMKMLPEKDRVIGDMRMTHMIQPSLYLSGDFLDYLRLDEHLSLVYIADVSGHGASSAFVTVLLKNLTNRLQRNLRRGSSEDILDPERFLKRVNHELKETGLGKHVTMFVGLIDARERVMRYAVGAHFPLPIITSGSETRFLEGSGLPVGLFADPHWETYTEPLPEGFRLILFSDGILEVINAKSLDQKEKRLLELVSSGRHTIESLSEALQLEEMSELPDDIAIVTVTDGRAVDE